MSYIDMMSPEQIFEAALALSAEKRQELAHALQQTLKPVFDFDDEFYDELDRRSAGLKDGSVRGILQDEAIAIVRSTFK